MTDDDCLAALMTVIGHGPMRESEIKATTGWTPERMREVLDLAHKALLVVPTRVAGMVDVRWANVDTVIALCPWTETDVMEAVSKGVFTTTELVLQSGGKHEPLRLRLARMEQSGKLRKSASRGRRKWVPGTQKRIIPNKRPVLRVDRLLNLVATHQPVKLETLAELTGRGRFYIRSRLTILRKRGVIRYDVLGDAWRYVLADFVRPIADVEGEILLRCKDAGGDCLTWEGAHSKQGHPLVRSGGNVKRVDIVLWTVVHGKTLKSGHTLNKTCGTPGCCNHAHDKQVTRSEAMRAAFAAIGFGGEKHGKKVSDAIRAKVGALTPEQVALIRSSPLSDGNMAKELGKNKSVITSARSHKTYRDYGSPFAGLGAR